MKPGISAEEFDVLKNVKRKIEELATIVGVGEKITVKNKPRGGSQVATKKQKSAARKKITAKRKVASDSVSDCFLVGIDLGTSRSALVAEDGKRCVVESVVGWPRDIIAIKMLGESIVFGAEAVKNRESLDILWPLADGVIKEGKGRGQEAAEELIRYMLAHAGVPKGRSVCGVIGIPGRASLQSKLLLLDIAQKCMDHVMLISEPFAVAYSEKKLNNSIVIDIGAGTADLCSMKGRIPDEDNQLTLTKAGNYVDRMLLEALHAKFPDASMTIHLAKKFKEKLGTVTSAKGKLVMRMRVDGVSQAHDITEEMVFACSSMLPDIIDGLKQLVLGFDPEFEDEVLQNIILAGGMSQIIGLDTAIEKALKDFGAVKVHTVTNSLYTGAEGALKLGDDIPVKFWNQIGDFGISAR